MSKPNYSENYASKAPGWRGEGRSCPSAARALTARPATGIHHVGLASRDDLDVPGVDQHELEAALLEDVPDGLPVLAGGLHDHLGHPLGFQPGGHLLQVVGEGGEERTCLLRTPWSSGLRMHTTTSSLGNVQAGTTFDHNLHSSTSFALTADGGGAGGAIRVNDAERRSREANSLRCREGPGSV
jgi:hypothetical protein